MAFNRQQKYQKGLTLLELLVVIGIILILAAITIVTIDPAEYLARSRDNQRIADLSRLHIALAAYVTAGVSTFSLAGPNSCAGQAAPKVFVSIPSSVTMPSNLPSGWSYGQAGAGSLRGVNGSGWLPVDLTSIPSGSPLGNLPVDPANDLNSNLYYSYVCKASPGVYELNAQLESKRYSKGGAGDKTSKDGGDDPTVYEAGSNLTLNPLAPVGYWAFDEGNGTAAGDSSKNGNNGTLTNGPAWQTEANCEVGKCLYFDGVDDYVTTNSSVLDFSATQSFSVAAWIKSSDWHTGDQANPVVQKYNWGPHDGWLLGIRSSNCFGMNLFSRTLMPGDQDRYVCITANGNMPLNSWHHVVGVVDRSANFAYFYLNGQLKASASIAGWISANTFNLNLNIGHYGSVISSWDYAAFQGSIDDVRIYSRALSAAEIKYYYNISK